MDRIPIHKLLENQAVQLSLDAPVRYMDYDWSSIAKTLTPLLMPMETAHEHHVVSVVQTMTAYGELHPLKSEADTTCALSFTRDLHNQTTILARTHDYDKNQVNCMETMFAPFVGRKSLTTALNQVRFKRHKLREGEPSSKKLLAFYRPEGILLIKKGDHDDIVDILTKRPQDRGAFCQVILPTPQSAHEQLAQEDHISSLLLLANLFYSTTHIGHAIQWTR